MPPSLIASDMRITGDLVSEGEVQIDGHIDGDIRCKSLLVGVTGCIDGEVDAEQVRVHGAIIGQVRAREVFMASTARLTGDILHDSLSIEPGAFLEGHIQRMDKETLAALDQEPPSLRAPETPASGDEKGEGLDESSQKGSVPTASPKPTFPVPARAS